MKRIICIALTLVLVLGLCACSGFGLSNKLQVGFGRVNITPDYTLELDGSATERFSEGFMDYIYVTCVALRHSEQTFLVYTMDFICATDRFVDPAKDAISEATGVPVENILMNATHTHSSISIRDNGMQNVDRYRSEFNAWAAEAGQLAIEDLSPAEAYTGSSQTEGLAFVRHYEMKDGTYAGPNFGSYSSGIVGHDGEADTEVQVIHFVREKKDKKDIVMMSFPVHATLTSAGSVISADIAGSTRDHIEANSDTLVAYYIAAGGNQTPSSRISSENSVHGKDYLVYGEVLGDYVLEVMKNETKVEGNAVTLKTQTYTGNSNKEKVDQIDEVQKLISYFAEVGRGSNQAAVAAEKAGFSSVYEVSAINNRVNFDDTQDMELKVMSIGNIGLLFAPYEMFGTTAMYIKEKSPYDFTFIVTCGEGDEGYLPTLRGWEIETYEAMVSRYERGTAEKVADIFIEMLTEVKGAQ